MIILAAWKESEIESSKSHKSFSVHYSNNVSCQPMFHRLVHSPLFISSYLSELQKHSICNKILEALISLSSEMNNSLCTPSRYKSRICTCDCKVKVLAYYPLSSRKKAALEGEKSEHYAISLQRQRLP